MPSARITLTPTSYRALLKVEVLVVGVLTPGAAVNPARVSWASIRFIAAAGLAPATRTSTVNANGSSVPPWEAPTRTPGTTGICLTGNPAGNDRTSVAGARPSTGPAPGVPTGVPDDPTDGTALDGADPVEGVATVGDPDPPQPVSAAPATRATAPSQLRVVMAAFKQLPARGGSEQRVRLGRMSSQQPEPQQENPDPRVMIINADGAPATPAAPGAEPVGEEVTDLIEEPAKVMRIGSMIRMLLEEVKAAPVDEAGRTRLATVLSTAISELKQGLAPELGNELDRLITPLSGATPSESELRIAQAQLVGWLEGLFHGIQTAIYAQQMAARAQLEQMQKALPPGLSSTEVGGPNDLTAASENSSGGMYL